MNYLHRAFNLIYLLTDFLRYSLDTSTNTIRSHSLVTQIQHLAKQLPLIGRSVKFPVKMYFVSDPISERVFITYLTLMDQIKFIFDFEENTILSIKLVTASHVATETEDIIFRFISKR